MSAKHYLITGATSGLGKHLSALLQANGATISTIGRLQDPDPIKLIMSMVRGFACFAELDGIIHCAGSEVVAPMRLTRDDGYELAMDAARIGFGLLAGAQQAGVMAKGSSIVLVSSVAAVKGSPGMVAYSASKGAVEAMARSAAVELAPRGIRVNCVRPGAFLSPMHERVTHNMTNEAKIAYAGKHPLGIGTVAGVAAAVLYLLRPDSNSVTGTVMTVDSGFSA